MSTRADYTEDEWILLRGTAWTAAYAIVLADRRNSPQDTWLEVQTMIRGFDEGPQLYPQNTLIADLAVPDYSMLPANGPVENPTAATMRAEALDECRRVATLLAQKSTPQEATECKRWLLRMAELTARAVTERGWLGRNEDPVSGREHALLAELAAALDLPAAPPAPV
jgi:hypothetical protein